MNMRWSIQAVEKCEVYLGGTPDFAINHENQADPLDVAGQRPAGLIGFYRVQQSSDRYSVDYLELCFRSVDDAFLYHLADTIKLRYHSVDFFALVVCKANSHSIRRYALFPKIIHGLPRKFYRVKCPRVCFVSDILIVFSYRRIYAFISCGIFCFKFFLYAKKIIDRDIHYGVNRNRHFVVDTESFSPLVEYRGEGDRICLFQIHNSNERCTGRDPSAERSYPLPGALHAAFTGWQRCDPSTGRDEECARYGEDDRSRDGQRDEVAGVARDCAKKFHVTAPSCPGDRSRGRLARATGMQAHFRNHDMRRAA